MGLYHHHRVVVRALFAGTFASAKDVIGRGATPPNRSRSIHNFLCTIVVGTLLVALSSAHAQEHLLQNGNWHLFRLTNAVTKRTDFFIAALDSKRTSSFILGCKAALHSFYFALEDSSLSQFPFGQRLRFFARLSREEPFPVEGSATGSSRVVVEERLHVDSFGVLLIGVYGQETAVGLSIGDLQWLFPLEGFSGAADELGRRCGFTPHQPQSSTETRP
jgi:hypothetical protein